MKTTEETSVAPELFPRPGETAYPSNPLFQNSFDEPSELFRKDVPADRAGVPRSDNRRLPKRSSASLLAGGLNVSAERPNGLEELLSGKPDENFKLEPSDALGDDTETEEEDKTNLNLPQVDQPDPESQVVADEPLVAPAAEVQPPPPSDKPVEEPKRRKSFWGSTLTGAFDGLTTTLNRSRKILDSTKSKSKSRLAKVAERAKGYRKAISESETANKIAQSVTDALVTGTTAVAAAGIWLVEVTAEGWLILTDGSWKITLAAADGLVWLASYGAAAAVEAAKSGQELFASILAWFTKSQATQQENVSSDQPTLEIA